MKVLEVDPGEATDLLTRGVLDAFFLISGQPAPTVGDLTARGVADLVPLAGKQIDGALKRHRFFSRDIIPLGTYTDVGAVETPSIGMRSEEHTSELQSLMRISYAVFCLQKP